MPARRRTRSGMFGLLTVLALSACTSTGPGTGASGTSGGDGTAAPTPSASAGEHRDVVGDGSQRHTMDVFTPQGKGDGPFPTVVWVHGGGWRMGDKSDLDSGDLQTGTMKRALLDRGYAVASVNYRLLPDGTHFPEPLQDVSAAVRYLKAHSNDLQLDPQRFAIGGESAGAHLAAMTALTSDRPDLQGDLGGAKADTKVKALVGYYGLYDLRQRTADQKASCGDMAEGKTGANSSHGRLIGADPDTPQGEPKAAAASPVTYVTKGSPATLLFAGTQDCTAPKAQSERFRDALTAAGVPAELTVVDAGHAQPVYYTDPAHTDQLLRFLDTHVKG